MTTSRKTQQPPSFEKIRRAFTIGELAYFQSRLKNRLHQLVLREFEKSGLNRAELARRIQKKPEQITRWLNSPGNLRIDTLSDLLLGTSYAELKDEIVSLKQPPRNFDKPAWLGQKEPETTIDRINNPPRDTSKQPQSDDNNLSGILRFR